MKSLLSYSFLLVFFLGTSQKKIDSLTTLLKETPAHTTTYVDQLNAIGYEYWIVDSRESLNYGKNALQLADSLGYNPGRAKANRVIGVALWNQGNYAGALKYLDTSKRLYSDLEDNEGIANTILNQAMVYTDLKEYDKALAMYDDAVNRFEALNLKSRVATTYTKIGSLYLAQNKPDYAKVHLENAMAIHSETDFTYGKAEVHNRMGIMYLDQDELEQAFYHISKSINLGRELNDKEGLTSNLLYFGKLLLKDKQYKYAYDHVMLSLNSAKDNGLKRYELLAYEALKDVKLAEGKADEAIEFYDKYIVLKDSIFDSDKAMQVAALEFENQLDTNKRELELLKEKQENNRLFQWVLSLGFLIFLVSGSIFYLSYKRQARQRKLIADSNAELAETALENSRLKQQELQQELDYRNKELTSYTLNFVQKSELFQLLKEKVDALKDATPAQHAKIVQDLNRLIKQNSNIDRDWEDFKRFFEEVHSGFIKVLKQKHPDLSSNDLKLSALTRLNLNIKESAAILGITPESVKTARYRLRKKLDLDQNEELLTYFLTLERPDS